MLSFRAFVVSCFVVLTMYRVLEVACPLFTDGPPSCERDVFGRLNVRSVCGEFVPLGYFTRPACKSVRFSETFGARHARVLPFVWNVFSLFLLLSGDVELNPGPIGVGDNLRYGQLNAQSVSATPQADKPMLIQNLIHDEGMDILALSETWLKPDSLPSTVNSITPDGYSCINVPRMNGRGGGVAFVFRSVFKFCQIRWPNFNFSSFEFVGAKLCLSSVSYMFVNVYRPPGPVSVFLDEFSRLLEDLVVSPSEIVISGDFNIHVDRDEEPAMGFSAILEAFGFQQHVGFPTHNHGHTLDLLITRSDSDLVTNIHPTCLPFSDHLAVSGDIRVPTLPRPREIFRRLRMFKNFDSAAFCHDLIGTGLNYVTEVSLDLYVNVFNSTVSLVLDTYAPWRRVKCSTKTSQPFFSRDLREQKRIRSNLESKWRRNKTEANFDRYKSQVKHFATLLRAAKQSYYRSLVNRFSGNGLRLWKVLSDVLSRRCVNVLPSGLTESSLAAKFSDYFVGKISDISARFGPVSVFNVFSDSPPIDPPHISKFLAATEEEVRQTILSMSDATCTLDVLPTPKLKECVNAFVKPVTTIVNKCFATGQFPTKFKHALVVPLLKKVNLPKDDLSSYRPVSHLNFISKVVERIIHNRLMAHLNSFPSLPAFQSAYRLFHSTETALTRVQNDLLRAMENQKVSALVLLDLSAAFDTVDHGILIKRLQSYFGISGDALNLLQSYLSGRTQSILIGDHESPPTSVTTGVPQGSILGPLLFTLYLTPLNNTSSMTAGVGSHFYADDTQIYISFSADDAAASLRHLSSALQGIYEWLSANRLALNADKTEYLIVGLRQQKAKLLNQSLDLNFAGSSIQPSEMVRNLGVLFDGDMSMKSHVSNLCRSSFMCIRSLRQIRSMLDFDSAKLVANALVMSKLDYCNSLLYGINAGLVNRLQRVQNTLARVVVPSVRRSDHISPTLRQLHWLPVRQRIDFKMALMTFKVLHNRAPVYLHDKLQPLPESSRRSSGRNLLSVPFTKSSVGRRSFEFASPTVWNSLPQGIRDCNQIDQFKKLLKTQLFPT